MNKPLSVSLPLSDEELAGLRAGQQLLLSGPCYTLRDASINRLADFVGSSENSNGISEKHVDSKPSCADSCTDERAEDSAKTYEVLELLAGQLIFFAGPTPAHPRTSDLPFGAIGPTTASRMDNAQIKLMPQGFKLSLGKGVRSNAYVQAAREEGAVYLSAVGGAAALLAQHVVESKLVAWPELGTEAVMRLRLKDFPVIVAIDSQGNDVYAMSAGSNVTNGACPASRACPIPDPEKQESRYKGILITFEGGEGVGKSTQIKLLEEALTKTGHEVLTVREPGSSTVSEAIRKILLCASNRQLSSRAELLLYEAARAQLTEEVIKPALEAGKVVLCDRFFDSTTAYQGYARGLDIKEIDRFNCFATDGIVPKLTIVLDLDPKIGLERAAATGIPDRLESENLAFHQKVREGFLAIATAHPERVKVFNAADDPHDLAAKILTALTAS